MSQLLGTITKPCILRYIHNTATYKGSTVGDVGKFDLEIDRAGQVLFQSRILVPSTDVAQSASAMVQVFLKPGDEIYAVSRCPSTTTGSFYHFVSVYVEFI